MTDPMPADRERETEQVETAIASLRAAVVDDNTLAEWFRPGYLLEVANLLDRLRGDAEELHGVIDWTADLLENGSFGVPCSSEEASHLHGTIDQALRSLSVARTPDAARAATSQNFTWSPDDAPR
jgi:hypothetical protein